MRLVTRGGHVKRRRQVSTAPRRGLAPVTVVHKVRLRLIHDPQELPAHQQRSATIHSTNALPTQLPTNSAHTSCQAGLTVRVEAGRGQASTAYNTVPSHRGVESLPYTRYF